jgi:hypothetical protein
MDTVKLLNEIASLIQRTGDYLVREKAIARFNAVCETNSPPLNSALEGLNRGVILVNPLTLSRFPS